MAIRRRDLLSTLLLPLTVVGLGCRTDDGVTTAPTEAQPALLPPVWEKPRISVAWMEPPVALVVKLYEVRHDELDRRRVTPDAKSVLDGAPATDVYPFFGELKVPIRTLAKGDAFLAELDSWSRAPTPPAVLVETIRAPERKSVGFEWDIPTNATPAIVELWISGQRLDDGGVRLQITRIPVSRPPVDQTNYIPGLNRGSKGDQIDIAADQSVAVGGLTIRQPKAPSKELRGLRLVTVAEETIELLAIISVAQL
jgi:hypothetical protein